MLYSIVQIDEFGEFLVFSTIICGYFVRFDFCVENNCDCVNVYPHEISHRSNVWKIRTGFSKKSYFSEFSTQIVRFMVSFIPNNATFPIFQENLIEYPEFLVYSA